MVIVPDNGFLFMRHGETEANARGIICGSTDLPLNRVGEEQADRTAEFLRGTNIRKIVTSSLLRARQTAASVTRVTGIEPQPVSGLAERNWGAWEGQPRSVLRRDDTPPGGESPGDFRARVIAAFEGMHLNEPTLIVAHSGVAREIHLYLTDQPHRRMENAELVLWSRISGQWNCHECFKPGR